MMTTTFPTITAGACAAKSLGTCSRLLARSGLDELLRGDGTYTLFAPTDKAFDALPSGTLESLENDPVQLRGVLEYHILSVRREISQLGNGKLPTLGGELLTASVTDDGLLLDHANTHGHAMRCANGLIHTIDAVLLPGFKRAISQEASAISAWSGQRPVARTLPEGPWKVSFK